MVASLAGLTLILVVAAAAAPSTRISNAAYAFYFATCNGQGFTANDTIVGNPPMMWARYDTTNRPAQRVAMRWRVRMWNQDTKRWETVETTPYYYDYATNDMVNTVSVPVETVFVGQRFLVVGASGNPFMFNVQETYYPRFATTYHLIVDMVWLRNRYSPRVAVSRFNPFDSNVNVPNRSIDCVVVQ
jgi:hypothetical protein